MQASSTHPVGSPEMIIFGTRQKGAVAGHAPARGTLIALGALGLLVAGVTVWGATTSQNLTATQRDLASTATQLAASKSEASQLASDKSDLTAANAQLTSDKSGLTTKVGSLNGQVGKQTQCITALQANSSELQRISELQRANFNRTAKGSASAKADQASLTDYYNAYRAAFSGRLSTANSWIAKGNAAIKTSNAQTRAMDKATSKIEAAEKALSISLAQSASTCGF